MPHHSTLNVVPFEATHQGPQLIPSLGLLQDLVEHLNACDGALDLLVVADELAVHALLDLASLQSARYDGASSCGAIARTEVSDDEEIIVYKHYRLGIILIQRDTFI